MAFEYQPFVQPYGASIGDLIARSHDAEAHAAEMIGQAQARAAEMKGAAWAGAATNIGHDIAAIPQEIARTKELQQRGALTDLQLKSGAISLAEQQKKQADDETLARIYQGAYGQAPAQTQPGFQGPTQPGSPAAPDASAPAASSALPPGMEQGADGVVTLKADYLTHAMAAAGMGDKIPEVLSNLTAYQEKAATLAKTRGEVAVQTRDALGALGATIEGAGNTPQAFHTAALLAIHNGQLTPDQIKPYLDLVDQNPANVATITAQLQRGSKEQTTLNTAAATAAARTTAAAKPTEATLALDAANPDSPTQAQSVAALARLKPPPAAKALEAKPDMVIKGTTNVPTFNPGDGSWSFAGHPVPADQVVRAAPPKDPMAQALQAVTLQTAQLNLSDKQRRDRNIDAIAEGMKQGTIAPDPEGLNRQGLYADVVGKLASDGVNFNVMRQQYLAQKRLINTENSPQGVRLDIAVRSGLAMYDKVDALSTQWDGLGLGLLSRANLKLATEGAKGPEAQKLALLLNGQIAQLTSDVATVEQNGMTPTNEARDVAKTGLESWWGDKSIHAMTAQGRANMRIRDTARKETVPLVPGAAQQDAHQVTVPANVAAALKGIAPGIHTLSDGSQWMVNADGSVTKP